VDYSLKVTIKSSRIAIKWNRQYKRAKSEAQGPNRRDFTEVIFLVVALFVLLLVWFQWDVAEVVTVFLMPFYWIFIVGIVLALVGAAIIRVFKWRKYRSRERLLVPFAIVTVLIFALRNIPFTRLYLELDFMLHTAMREEVVQLIRVGEIDFGGEKDGRVSLPRRYAGLSKSGDVLIHITDGTVNVFFFTFNGVADNFSGYAYTSEYTESGIRDIFRIGELQEFAKKKEHWYWISSS
jgi:hypothetical protein